MLYDSRNVFTESNALNGRKLFSRSKPKHKHKGFGGGVGGWMDLLLFFRLVQGWDQLQVHENETDDIIEEWYVTWIEINVASSSSAPFTNDLACQNLVK